MQEEIETRQADFSGLVAFNESLRSISQSGLPTRIFDGRYEDLFQQDLSEIESTVARRLGLGESFHEILRGDDIAPRYSAAFRSWTLCVPPEVTFGYLVADPLENEDERAAWTLSFRRMILLFVVGVVVLAIHHYQTRPQWLAFYQAVSLDDQGLGLRSTFSAFLIALIVLGILLCWVGSRWVRITSLLHPGRRRSAKGTRPNSRASNRLDTPESKMVSRAYGKIFQQGVPDEIALKESIRLVTNQQAVPVNPDGMLAWATAPLSSTVESQRDQRMQRIGLAAKVFDRFDHHRYTSRVWIPRLLEAVVGGALVLLAGYQFLGPYVRLIEALM